MKTVYYLDDFSERVVHTYNLHCILYTCELISMSEQMCISQLNTSREKYREGETLALLLQ